MKTIVRTVLVAGLAVISCAHSERAQQTAASADSPQASSDDVASSQDTDNGWPRTLSSGSDQITIYQPQIESWNGNVLQGRAAVSVQLAASSQPVYGVVWFTARTEVDKENRLVTLQDVQLTKTSFPSQPERASQYAQAIGPQLSSGIQTIALDRLQASLAVTQAEEKQATVAVKNAPPRILYSATPAVLILIDGEPVLRKVEGTNLLRIINTRSLILLDSSSGTYYFLLGNRWMQAPAATGPWTQTQNVPPSLDAAKQAAAKDKLVDLLDDPNSPVISELQRGVVPTIYVSTTPAELIQTDGKPQLQPIANTQLLEVSNASADLFLDEADQQSYVLLSGRWYRSPSLEKGPWSFVAANKLPADFSQVPESHPKGAVLASVAGTPQAQEAAIANQIPQTATVNRSQAQLTVQYDGTPQFKPVCETSLTYAVNTATPVVQIGPTAYYAVSGGVWFTASSPNGPWTVAGFVPKEIYSIPLCSPIYHVTHVYVYGSTPEVVYAGYTPGYLGSFIAPDGVVVFGTGYVYPPWIGTVWVGAPATFGFGVSWSLGFGWGFGGFAFGGLWGGPLFHPWWGPYGWGWGHRNIVVNNIHYTNIYRSSWHRNVVVNHWDRHAFANRGPMPRGPRAPNSVYAGRDGHAYRNSGSSWQRFDRSGWHPAPGANAPQARPPSGPSPATRAPAPTFSHGPGNELGHESFARNSGASHWNAFRGGGGFHGGFGGGGFHGGGRR